MLVFVIFVVFVIEPCAAYDDVTTHWCVCKIIPNVYDIVYNVTRRLNFIAITSGSISIKFWWMMTVLIVVSIGPTIHALFYKLFARSTLFIRLKCLTNVRQDMRGVHVPYDLRTARAVKFPAVQCPPPRHTHTHTRVSAALAQVDKECRVKACAPVRLGGATAFRQRRRLGRSATMTQRRIFDL